MVVLRLLDGQGIGDGLPGRQGIVLPPLGIEGASTICQGFRRPVQWMITPSPLSSSPPPNSLYTGGRNRLVPSKVRFSTSWLCPRNRSQGFLLEGKGFFSVIPCFFPFRDIDHHDSVVEILSVLQLQIAAPIGRIFRPFRTAPMALPSMERPNKSSRERITMVSASRYRNRSVSPFSTLAI